jgi:hypothetical protein
MRQLQNSTKSPDFSFAPVGAVRSDSLLMSPDEKEAAQRARNALRSRLRRAKVKEEKMRLANSGTNGNGIKADESITNAHQPEGSTSADPTVVAELVRTLLQQQSATGGSNLVTSGQRHPGSFYQTNPASQADSFQQLNSIQVQGNGLQPVAMYPNSSSLYFPSSNQAASSVLNLPGIQTPAGFFPIQAVNQLQNSLGLGQQVMPPAQLNINVSQNLFPQSMQHTMQHPLSVNISQNVYSQPGYQGQLGFNQGLNMMQQPHFSTDQLRTHHTDALQSALQPHLLQGLHQQGLALQSQTALSLRQLLAQSSGPVLQNQHQFIGQPLAVAHSTQQPSSLTSEQVQLLQAILQRESQSTQSNSGETDQRDRTGSQGGGKLSWPWQ